MAAIELITYCALMAVIATPSGIDAPPNSPDSSNHDIFMKPCSNESQSAKRESAADIGRSVKDRDNGGTNQTITNTKNEPYARYPYDHSEWYDKVNRLCFAAVLAIAVSGTIVVLFFTIT